jgi:maleylacetoacetate isomerase
VAEITLYNYWRSSSSHRVRIALAYKGLPFTYAAIDLLEDEQSSETHRSRSPMGYVPCLTLDGVTYFESVAIIELLEERFPAPALLPEGSHGRARVRALVEMVNSGIQPLQNRHLLSYVSADADVRSKWLQHFLSRGLAALESALALYGREGVDGPFAYGKAPTAADVFLVPQVAAASRFRVELAPYRRVMRAFDAASALEAFQRAAPERQPDRPAGPR